MPLGHCPASPGHAMSDETILGNPRTIMKQTGNRSVANKTAVKTPGGSYEPFIALSGPFDHLKIVVVALVAGIAVAGFGISARTNSDYSQTAQRR